MRRLGQHFLKNPSILTAIARAAAPQKGESVIEIGPGHGELTVPLLELAQAAGATMTVIERDRSLIPALRTIADRFPALAVVEGDALHALAAAVPPGPYVLAGNIPYYITGKLLRTIGELEHKPRITVLLIQKEVAERICAGPPHMNRLAASLQYWADVKMVAAVPRRDFSPAPAVDSAVITLTTLPEKRPVPSALYYRAVKAVFAQPRKTIFNNVFAAAPQTGKATVMSALEHSLILPDDRPQNITIEQLSALAAAEIWG